MAKSKKSVSRVTINDVALRAGLSIATVSRVINRTAPVSEETTKRVLAAIKELDYVPHQAARQLASRKTSMLGLILDEIGGDFFSPMLRGIEAGAREEGYNLLIATTQGESGIGVIGEHNTDGMLVFDDCLPDDELQRLHATGFPVVLLYRNPPQGLDIPSVAFENKNGARQMTDHLIERCGHSRIAFLKGPPNNEDARWREKGYRESLEAHGIPFDPYLVAVGGFDDHEAEAAVERMLAEGTQMDAIFAGDDESAIGAMLALRYAGLRVPEDIAVVGFDDIPIARHLTPPLTTIRAPIESTGYEAARQLINLIEHGSAEPLSLLPTELVVRESCGCHVIGPDSS
jgi:LacI family transcriptional regulator